MRSLFSNSLTQRLTLIYALLVIVLVALSFLALYLSISHIIADRLNKDLVGDIADFHDIYQTGGLTSVIEEIDEESLTGKNENEILILLDSAGETVHSSDLSTWPDLESVIDTAMSLGANRSYAGVNIVEFSTKESPVHVISERLDTNYRLVIGEVAEDNEEILELLFVALFLVFALALPLVFLLVWILTRQAVSGIQKVSNAADQISTGDLTVRVNARGQVAEIQSLADTFDAMAVRIQQLNINTREMMDDIAHDMRSPLGRIRLFTESLLKEDAIPKSLRCAATSAVADCDHLIYMINTSLDVSETEVGASPVEMKPLDFHILVADVFELFEPAANDKGLTYHMFKSDSAIVLGDSSSLQRMIANLLDNAVKFTPSGCSISLAMGVVQNSAQVRLTNTGVALSEKMQIRVFDRFYRGDQSRGGSGTGLGLSFARAVAVSHKGNIQVISNGNEVEFIVQIPLISAASL